MTDESGEDEWDYYIVHDSIGVSHVMRTRKGSHRNRVRRLRRLKPIIEDPSNGRESLLKEL